MSIPKELYIEFIKFKDLEEKVIGIIFSVRYSQIIYVHDRIDCSGYNTKTKEISFHSMLKEPFI